jgi:bacteriocin biosynthesis cyclodehydratase domain-containing protein
LLLLLARVLQGLSTPVAQPLLAPWYRVVGDGDRLLLEYAQSLVVLDGNAVRTLLPALLPLLDGTRSVDDLAARLGPAARPAIEAAIELLVARGVVIDGPDAPSDIRTPARRAAAAYGLSPTVASERLRHSAVGIVGSGEVRLEIVRLLAAAGIRNLRRLGWRGRGRADLAVVAPAADELDRLHDWNCAALDRGSAYLLISPWDGRTARVGPLVLPHQTCCYDCLQLRLGASSGYAAEFAEVAATPLAVAPDPSVAAITAALAAQLTVRWLIGGDAAVPGSLSTVETRPALRIDVHTVLRVPRCPSCSVAERSVPPLPWHAAAA